MSKAATAGKLFIDEFKAPRDVYKTTQFPIVLCHGLLGFDTVTLPTGHRISYFNGVKEALQKQGAHVIAKSVPPVAQIELRAKRLYDSLLSSVKQRATGSKRYPVNIVAHSMGGLDARYMISHLIEPDSVLNVVSLTTLSTPHQGSPVADLFRPITRILTPNYGAFVQLTTGYMQNVFNKRTKNDPRVQYFSYGAKFTPSLLSPFYLPSRYIQKWEGDNDGMVSVRSSQWGQYLGTIDSVDHADIINMTRIKPRKLLNHNYSSPAMYLSIMDDLAQRGF